MSAFFILIKRIRLTFQKSNMTISSGIYKIVSHYQQAALCYSNKNISSLKFITTCPVGTIFVVVVWLLSYAPLKNCLVKREPTSIPNRNINLSNQFSAAVEIPLPLRQRIVLPRYLNLQLCSGVFPVHSSFPRSGRDHHKKFHSWK